MDEVADGEDSRRVVRWASFSRQRMLNGMGRIDGGGCWQSCGWVGWFQWLPVEETDKVTKVKRIRGCKRSDHEQLTIARFSYQSRFSFSVSYQEAECGAAACAQRGGPLQLALALSQ